MWIPNIALELQFSKWTLEMSPSPLRWGSRVGMCMEGEQAQVSATSHPHCHRRGSRFCFSCTSIYFTVLMFKASFAEKSQWSKVKKKEEENQNYFRDTIRSAIGTMAPKEHVLISDREEDESHRQGLESKDQGETCTKLCLESLLWTERARQAVHSGSTWDPTGPGIPVLLIWLFFPGSNQTSLEKSP